MKRLLSAVSALVLVIIMSACSSNNEGESSLVSGSGTVEFTSSSTVEQLPVPESPPAVSEGVGDNTSSTTTAVKPMPAEVRSVWVSYLELEKLMNGHSEGEFRASIAKMFSNCANFGLNTVVFHVRPFGDAIYPSQLFPQSYLFTGEEGAVGSAPYDALAIAVDEAKKHKLRLEAWINPYRVRNKGDKSLHDTNPANALLASGDAVRNGEVVTYNPASEAAQQLIVDGVVEILERYDVDAIHFDDYFYPTTDAAFDDDFYQSYSVEGGDKSLAEWRRSNVTTLVRKVHEAIDRTKPSVLFGISPQGNMGNNLNSQFVDVETIIRANLIDYICPQMYFGYDNGGTPYLSTIEEFDRMTQGSNVELYVGLCTYKFNKVDTWAGNGKNEWIGTTDILTRQVESARKLGSYSGFVLYRYDSSFAGEAFYSADTKAQSQLVTEMENLSKVLD